jgi:hypothetical protein
MIKPMYWGASVAVAIASFILFANSSVSAEITPGQVLSQAMPRAPRNPPPNRSRPGGGLNPDVAACRGVGDRLRALVPIENPVLTTAAHPTILFYVPFGADTIQYGEFMLLSWPQEREWVYNIRFMLPAHGGIVKVTLPTQAQTALQEDRTYHWYFQLYCKGGNGEQPDISVDGYIQRVAATPERDRQIAQATAEIWYDSLANVATQLQTAPQDGELRRQWRSLLQTIGAEEVAPADFAGSVIPIAPQ